jgi:hypothetical protein
MATLVILHTWVFNMGISWKVGSNAIREVKEALFAILTYLQGAARSLHEKMCTDYRANIASLLVISRSYINAACWCVDAKANTLALCIAELDIEIWYDLWACNAAPMLYKMIGETLFHTSYRHCYYSSQWFLQTLHHSSAFYQIFHRLVPCLLTAAFSGR